MRIEEFAQQLQKARDEKAAERTLQAYLKSFGFRCFAFTYYTQHIKTGQKLRYEYASPALRPWHQHYLNENYADVDRTLENYYKMNLPLYWDVQLQLKQAKNKREQRIRQESIDFGIDKGLSIPVHGAYNDFASLTLHQCKHETCLKNYFYLQYEWLSAAHLYYYFLKEILDKQKPAPSSKTLTRREKQCLDLTAQSFNVNDIAKKLNISMSTVNFHLQNANKKLGVNNKYQALLKWLEYSQ
ncbi:MAG: Transcriptional regulator, LuxR family with an autoinducer-binding domain [Gammaproteobacteria bacterium]|jgi:LuxR family transcriptional activator of bioluminescence operon|nr:Transcriptional regulator, LuxR family with an autoinducer-binding domain [Gammaproteobacteria bacterium]